MSDTMSDPLKDLLDVPADDSAAAYGAGDHAASVDALGAGKFGAADEGPSEPYDTRADGSKQR
jgi:hypothetical protein